MSQKFKNGDKVRIKSSGRIGKIIEVDRYKLDNKKTRGIYWVKVKGYVTQVRLFSYQLEKA